MAMRLQAEMLLKSRAEARGSQKMGVVRNQRFDQGLANLRSFRNDYAANPYFGTPLFWFKYRAPVSLLRCCLRPLCVLWLHYVWSHVRHHMRMFV